VALADELREEGQGEEQHLRVGDVGQEALAERVVGHGFLWFVRCGVAVEQAAGDRERQPEQVGRADPAQGHQYRRVAGQDHAQAGDHHAHLDEAGGVDACQRPQARARPVAHRGAQQQERVHARREHDHRAGDQEGR
jgi:hypothetical protein